jgi:hypothetical protein
LHLIMCNVFCQWTQNGAKQQTRFVPAVVHPDEIERLYMHMAYNNVNRT